MRADKTFSYTEAVPGPTEGGEVTLDSAPVGYQVQYHTHNPNLKFPSAFSGKDKIQSRRWSIPSFIITPFGKIKKFDPNTNKVKEILKGLRGCKC